MWRWNSGPNKFGEMWCITVSAHGYILSLTTLPATVAALGLSYKVKWTASATVSALGYILHRFSMVSGFSTQLLVNM